jgi:hypothetical protein
MTKIHSIAIVAICLAPNAVLGEGLIYQLPVDGAWVRFDVDAKGAEPDGSEVKMTGALTMSSVGTSDVDGQRCRWIEIAYESTANGQPWIEVNKLLIPEKHLGKGKEPLENVVKWWMKHSMVADGTPQQVKDLKGQGAVYVTRARPMLHGPFQMPEKLDKVPVESKLGKLECEGLVAREKTDDTQSKVSYDSKYTIRLHPDAPFGVVTWQHEMKGLRDGQPQRTVNLELKLADYGKNAKSALPDSD